MIMQAQSGIHEYILPFHEGILYNQTLVKSCCSPGLIANKKQQKPNKYLNLHERTIVFNVF